MPSPANPSPSPEKRIRELQSLLKDADARYYGEAHSPMTDETYDGLVKELEALEAAHPEFAAPDSVTREVGSDLQPGFKRRTHLFPMLSIQNAYSEEEVADFDRQVREKIPGDELEYVLELKIDGVALSLVYESRKLAYAVTRGDGVQGDDVTRNVKTIATIPQGLPAGFPEGRVEVRGEVYMTKANFEAFNAYSLEHYGKEQQNPRNTASGSLKLKNPEETAKRPLDFFAYNLLGDAQKPTHRENLAALEAAGFPVYAQVAVEKDVPGIMARCEAWKPLRDALEYHIDGVVVKVNRLAHQNTLGRTSKSPKWVIAYKYKTEAAETLLETVSYQVGRTGAVTPVAHLRPVLLGGTVVKRATLHNFEEIERLGLQMPDVVTVEKGGEIIPKITSVKLEARPADSRPIEPPKACPECGGELNRPEGEVVLRCENLQCPAQTQRAILHFVSRGAMNIDHIGVALVEALGAAGKLRVPADLYDLTEADLLSLDRMAEKSAARVLQTIRDSKDRGLEKLLFGLGIRHVGKTVAQILARHFKDIDALAKASEEELASVHEVGPRIAASVKAFFASETNLAHVARLRAAGLSVQASVEAGSQPLSGQTWVVTGTLPNWSRDEAREALERAGARVSDSVSKKTTAVLVGENAGSKLAKAEKLGIRTMTEEEVRKLLA